MQNNSIETNDPVVERLCVLTRERPDLKDAARVYEAILPLLRDAGLRVVPVSLTCEEAREKMDKGIPLLSGPDLELDEQAMRHLMLMLAHSFENVSGLQNSCEYGPPGRFRLAIEENKIDIRALLSHALADDYDFIETIARGIDIDPDLVRVLTRYALNPALNDWRRQLAPLAEGIQWEKGYCFICGADPTLGELRENGQVLHLRCGQCGADWQFRRLKCIWCGNEDHRSLSCLYSEDQREKMRVEVCDKCRGYLKVISSFYPTLPEMLPVEDLATLHLDYVAIEHGYERRRGRYD